MSKLRVQSFAISIDGYGAGPKQDLQNPLGVRGVGEGGAISPPAAVSNAIEDALAPFGVRITETPVSPARLMALLAQAR